MEAEIRNAAEIIPDKFYFMSCRTLPPASATLAFFCIDNELVYEPFYADFGPLNLGCAYQYAQIVKQQLHAPANANKKVVHYCSVDGHKRANAAYLVGSFMILEMGMAAEDAWKPLKGAYLPFRDASYGICTYNITLMDCFRALEKARQFGWIDFTRFDVQEYQHYEKVENGDLNVIIPGKFIAFSGPSAVKQEIGDGIFTMIPEDYTEIFRKKGITAIVRLNKKVYDRRQFTDYGFRHYEMYFVDGGTPTDAIIRKFLEVCENEQGVAVHCKAGLGRTGTLIGLYMMKHFRLTANEVIAYLRVCRPGSVIGPQQHFLKDYEQRMWKAGETARRRVSSAEGSGMTSAMKSLDLSSEGYSPALLPRTSTALSPQSSSPQSLSPLRGISRGRAPLAPVGRSVSNSPLRSLSSFNSPSRNSKDRDIESLGINVSSPLRRSNNGNISANSMNGNSASSVNGVNGGGRLASLLSRSALGASHRYAQSNNEGADTSLSSLSALSRGKDQKKSSPYSTVLRTPRLGGRS